MLEKDSELEITNQEWVARYVGVITISIGAGELLRNDPWGALALSLIGLGINAFVFKRQKQGSAQF